MINIIQDGEEYEVWLDTEVAQRDGICLAVARTERTALKRALRELKRASDEVRKEMRSR